MKKLKLSMIFAAVALLAIGCSNLWDYDPPKKNTPPPITNNDPPLKELKYYVNDGSDTPKLVTVTKKGDTATLKEIQDAFKKQYPDWTPPTDWKEDAWYETATNDKASGAYQDGGELMIGFVPDPDGGKPFGYSVTITTEDSNGKVLLDTKLKGPFAGIQTLKSLIDSVAAEGDLDANTKGPKASPPGKAFNGWIVTKPDGSTEIVYTSQIASYGDLENGTKIAPNWVDQYVANLGTDADGDDILVGFTKIIGNGTEIGDFYISNTEVTRAQWVATMGIDYDSHKEPGDTYWQDDDNWYIKSGKLLWQYARTSSATNMDMPINYINWYDEIMFCNRLSEIDNRKPYYKFKHDSTRCKVPAQHDPIVIGADYDENNYLHLQKLYTPTYIDRTGGEHKRDVWDCIIVYEDKQYDNTRYAGYRMPSHEYWKYAAHGGEGQPYPTFSGTTYVGERDSSGRLTNSTNNINALIQVAWCQANSSGNVKPVGELGGDNPVRDMTGNVTEWCWDEFGTGTHDGWKYQKGTHLYTGGPANDGNNLYYHDIDNLYNLINAEGKAGETADRSKGMGMRIIVPVWGKK